MATANAVWVACTTDNVVVRLDPATWAAAARNITPTAPDGLVAGPDGRLRLVAQQGPTLVVIDPNTDAVVSEQALGVLPQLYDQANLAVAVTADATWVSSFSADAVHRVPPAEPHTEAAPQLVTNGRVACAVQAWSTGWVGLARKPAAICAAHGDLP